MNYNKSLEILNKLLALVDNVKTNKGAIDPKVHTDLCMKYGEVEDLVRRITGDRSIRVDVGPGLFYPNYIEAGYLSKSLEYRIEGYNELLKVIGKVRQLANDPVIPRHEMSVTQLIQTLRRFRECCKYIRKPPSDEKEVQDILWIMLRSQFDRLDREETLPKFGLKQYRPDFGIPELGILIEVKYIGEKTDPKITQDQIIADVPGYLNDSTNYDSLVELVYDAAHKLRDSRKFEDDLKTVEGIDDVIIVPGFG